MKRSFTRNMILAAFVAVLGFQGGSANADALRWSVDGFDQPESVYFDTRHQKVFVSNINGAPNEQNNKGYIALLSNTGEVLNKHWATGMDAPKGMAIAGGYLFVSDIQRLHKIDIRDGKIVQTYSVENAKFLNDVTARKDGDIYVSDMMDDTIYKLEGDQLQLWLKSPKIAHPNGLDVENDTLFVGTWGEGLQDDFTTKKAGSLLAVNLNSKEIAPVKGGDQLGNLDGVFHINGQTVANDWITGQVYLVTKEGQSREIGAFNKGLADISSDGETIFMPFMFEGRVEARSFTSLVSK